MLTGRGMGAALFWFAYAASLVHVYVESRRDKRVGSPFAHAFLVALVCWPLGYVLWLFVWPGSLRQLIFGSDEERIRRRVHERFHSDTPTGETAGIAARVFALVSRRPSRALRGALYGGIIGVCLLGLGITMWMLASMLGLEGNAASDFRSGLRELLVIGPLYIGAFAVAGAAIGALWKFGSWWLPALGIGFLAVFIGMFMIGTAVWLAGVTGPPWDRRGITFLSFYAAIQGTIVGVGIRYSHKRTQKQEHESESRTPGGVDNNHD